jgi:hypothetical protein
MSDGSIELAVAIGRIEEMLKSMNDKLDKLENTTERHWKKIAEHDTEIELLKQRQAPRIHWITWVAAAAAASSFLLFILDRFYGGTTP